MKIISVFEFIIKTSSIIGAIGAIIAGIVAVYKVVRNIERQYDKIQEHMLENYKSILQLKIMSSEMPLSERVAAANAYLSDKIKGNGGVKAYCNQELYPRWAAEQRERSGGNGDD